MMKNQDVTDPIKSGADIVQRDGAEVDESWALALLDDALDEKLDNELKEELAEAREHIIVEDGELLKPSQSASLSAIELQQQSFKRIKKFNTRSEVMANTRGRRWLANLIEKFSEINYGQYRVPVRDPRLRAILLKKKG